jgi:hypothetical protein
VGIDTTCSSVSINRSGSVLAQSGRYRPHWSSGSQYRAHYYPTMARAALCDVLASDWSMIFNLNSKLTV